MGACCIFLSVSVLILVTRLVRFVFELIIHPQAGSGSKRCLKVLLDAGTDGNAANEDGLTPALIAAQAGHAGCLWVLANAGVDLSIRDLSGNSATALAAMGEHLNHLEVHYVGTVVACFKLGVPCERKSQ